MSVTRAALYSITLALLDAFSNLPTIGSRSRPSARICSQRVDASEDRVLANLELSHIDEI